MMSADGGSMKEGEVPIKAIVSLGKDDVSVAYTNSYKETNFVKSLSTLDKKLAPVRIITEPKTS
jgi:hypothetical protein